MKQYEALLLDLDDTLYPYDVTHAAAIHALYTTLEEQHGVKKDNAEAAFRKARDRVNHQLYGTASSHNRLLYIQGLCEYLNINPAKYALSLYDAYWDTFLKEMVLFPQAREFLSAWTALGKRICLVTDLTAHIQFRKLSILGLEDYFDKIITSEEVGHEKPHPAVFMFALEKLQLNKHQVVMLGDNLNKDVLGAKRIGIDALWFSPALMEKEGNHAVNFAKLLEMLK